MRIPAIEKAGFYPTHDAVVEVIKTYIQPAEAGQSRLLDPCCGEGRAASILGAALNCKTWGAELSYTRAAQAAAVMDKVHLTAWEACTLAEESVNLLFLNPPYDFDRVEHQGRLEQSFLKSSYAKLVRGGLLVYIVPQKVCALADVAKILAGYFEKFTIGRYADSAYGQVVILAVRSQAYHVPMAEDIEKIRAWATADLPVLAPAAEPIYTLTPAPVRGAAGRAIIFKRSDWTDEEVALAALEKGVTQTTAWKDLLNPRRAEGQLLRPVMPLKKGHIAMLMASGMMGVVRLKDQQGKTLLVKGRVVKVQEVVAGDHDDEGDGEDGDGADTEIIRDRFVTTVATVQQSGIKVISDVEGLTEFMGEHGESIAAHVLDTYRPLYNMDPTDAENAILDTLGKGRKPLPGQAEPGLLMTQRHAAVAMARSVRVNGVGNVQGEMGVGKASWNGARVYTPDGYKLMGEIRVGDYVIGADGNPTVVLGVYPQGRKALYRVKFSDGSSTVVTKEHLWEINSPLRKWKGRPASVKTTSDIRSHLTHTNGNRQCFIPMIEPVQFAEKPIGLIDPYLLGVILGDGGLSAGVVHVSLPDKEIEDQVRGLLPEGVSLKQRGIRYYDFAVISGRNGKSNPVLDALRSLNLVGCHSYDKHIPAQYLYNSVNVRVALLQGLLDTDGYANKTVIEYSTTSKALADGMVELVQSLGGIARVKEKYPKFTYKGETRQGRLAYRIKITLPPEIVPFRLTRKLEKYNAPVKYLPSRSVTSVEYIGKGEATCIYVEDERHLYATDGFILTHNTTLAAGVTALLNAFPAIIVCPPHLVPKWIREIEETIPGAKAVELRRIGRNADDPGDINDVKAFFDAVEAGTLGEKPVAVVANTSAKMGPGWKPAVATRTIREKRYGKWVTKTVLCCPKCGHPVMDDHGAAITVDGKLPKRRLFCQGIVPGWEMDGEGRIRRNAEGNAIWGKRTCANPLFVMDQARRWSIAEYISKHCKGKFKLLIADEVHQFKGQSSDRGIAFHQLVTACKWRLTLTGTFFGGKSTSIFWLLYRLNAGVRRDFTYNEETRWAKLYGVLESKVKRRDDDGEDGIFTGNRRRHSKAKEQPGISPAIINRLLDTTVFLSLKDLGIQLPGYQEEVITLDMPDTQGHQYYGMDRLLKQQAMDDNRYLSVWLQWSLARPNSGFRDESVIVEGIDDEGKKTGLKTNLMDLPAVVDPDTEGLPKETWLANYCLAERQQGRKVLVYLRQTGTRDIQDRVQAVLEKAGLRVTVLHGSIDPRKREEWIAKRTPATDVLICNPKLVETGLDLIAYSTVIFYEIEYSLYTLWQAVRRVWRLGQTQAVKALFSVYEGAMESVALALMGRKMKAAQLLYGDEVGGAIVPESEGDFLTQLARELLAGSKLPDLATLFAEDTQVSHNPLGSMTTPSVVMAIPVETWEDWLQQRGGVVARKKRRTTAPAVLPGQASLF